jgi:hypothetical protein
MEWMSISGALKKSTKVSNTVPPVVDTNRTLKMRNV